MSIIRHISAGLRRLFRKERVERELDHEVQHFLEMATRAHMERGKPRDAALRAARLEMGGTKAVKEDARSGGWEAEVEAVVRDVRYGARSLRRNPSYALMAALTLGLGVGALTTMFSLLNAVLLRPPAHVEAPERLVSLYTSDFSGPPMGASSYPDFLEIAQQGDVFVGVMLSRLARVTTGEGESAEQRVVELVSGNYFLTLGVRPALGRDFATDEDRIGAPVAVGVIAHDLWQRVLGGRPLRGDETILMNGNRFCRPWRRACGVRRECSRPRH